MRSRWSASASLFLCLIIAESIRGDSRPAAKHPDVSRLPPAAAQLYGDTTLFPRPTKWLNVPWLLDLNSRFGTPQVTLEIAAPRKEPVVGVHAAAHLASGNPPRPDIRSHIEYSLDGGKTWMPMVKDWAIPRRGDEPADFWSQSFCWGSAELERTTASRVQVRFHNTGGKAYLRAEAHLLYRVPGSGSTKVTYVWTDSGGTHQSSHIFAGINKESPSWQIPTGQDTRTRWVEMETVGSE